MSKAVIQELRPKTPIEWILADECVNAQFSAMRYRTWQAAVMQFSVAEGLTRAVATLHDTSVKMIERTYSRYIASHGDEIARRALLETDAQPPTADKAMTLAKDH